MPRSRTLDLVDRVITRRWAALGAISFLTSLAGGCAPEVFPVIDREPGVAAPLTADCDSLDETRCLLPWPSSTFTTLDDSTATGIRVTATVASINDEDDVGSSFDADGFSRVTSVIAGFPGTLDESVVGGPLGGTLRLFVASPSHPRYGEEEPVRIEVVTERRGMAITSVIIGDPLTVLEAATEYVVVVTDDVQGDVPPVASRSALVALGRVAPASPEEALIAGYHAPTRALLELVGQDPEHVLRVWDFSTRSEDEAGRPLLSMRDQAIAAVTEGRVSVEIDEVTHPEGGAIETIVVGRLVGLPGWLDAAGFLVYGDDGLPEVQVEVSAPFRVTIPRGTGDYRVVLYGHGAAGSVRDSSFDDTMAENAIGKVNVEFAGWTEDTLVDNLVAVATNLMIGARHLLAPLAQSAAHALAIERAITGVIGDAISAAELGGMPNPSAGRRPGLDGPLWVGGSLGGTMGLVITSLSSSLTRGVLNVPGAAWSQWVPDSYFFGFFEASLRNVNGGDVNVAILAAMSQLIFDVVDGASFGHLPEAQDDVFLVQESIGDEVLPNDGNEFVAILLDATMIGAPLHAVHGLESATEIRGASGLTQYRVTSSDVYDVHGFAAKQDTVAGQAAFEQIRLFLDSSWAGETRIAVPTLCPAMSCDFGD